MTRLDALLSRWDDDALAPAETKELLALLETPAARAELVRRWALAQALRDGLPLARPAKVRRWRLVPLAAAAALLAMLVPLAAWMLRPSPVPVARLVEVGGLVEVIDERGVARTALAGQALFAGESLATGDGEGFAALEYPDRTRFELHADTRVRLSGERVDLASGMVRADVTARPAGQPMVLATSEGEIRANESRFLVSSPVDGTMHVDLEEGSADMVRGDGPPVALAAQALPAPARRGRRIEAKGGLAVRWLPDGTLQVAGRNWLREARPGGKVTQVALPVRKGRVLFGGGSLVVALPAQASLYGLEPLSLRSAHPVRGDSLALSADGARLAWAEPRRGFLNLLDAATGRKRQFPLPAGRPPFVLAFAPDGERLAVASGAGLRELRASDARALRSLRGMASPARLLAYSPDGTRLAGCAADGVLHVWGDAEEPALSLRQHGRAVTALAFSPDGARLAAGTSDGQAWVFDSRTGMASCAIRAGRRAAWGLAFSPDGQRLAVGIQAGPLTEWALPSP